MSSFESGPFSDVRRNAKSAEGEREGFAISRRSFLYIGMISGAVAAPALGGPKASRGGPETAEHKPLGLTGALPFRQIHLDFHTSPAVPSVGEAFRASEFAEILKDAAVNSITIFAKCNQGMSYYPTKVGVMHPHLKFDLLGEMIEACHSQDIRTVIYISTMYDQYAWQHHGDWRVLDAEGREAGLFQETGPLKAQLGRVCINTPYLEPKPIPEPHFPDRLHLFVWRNWELANADRMAQALKTTSDKVLEIGAPMGLPKKPELTKDQLCRIHVTTIRQNWHILPDEQIEQPLGWNSREYEYRLKEDDFLWAKLGMLKPHCKALKYEAPSIRAKRRAAEIKRLVEDTPGFTIHE